MIAGIVFGVLIGIISAITITILVKTFERSRTVKASTVTALLIELSSIPIFILGGDWMDRLPAIDFDFNVYLLTFMIFCVGPIILPLYRWIIQSAEELSKKQY